MPQLKLFGVPLTIWDNPGLAACFSPRLHGIGGDAKREKEWRSAFDLFPRLKLSAVLAMQAMDRKELPHGEFVVRGPTILLRTIPPYASVETDPIDFAQVPE